MLPRLCALFLLAPLIICAADVPPRASNGTGGQTGTFPSETIDVNRQSREFRLVVPAGIDPAKPAPLVFAFHGLLDSKDTMPLYSQLPALAQKKNFILVFPNGKARHWPLIPALARNDVAFFDELYASLTKKYNIDLNRVYVTGMSNGAYFSHLLAAQRSDKIAAIAPHSGGMAFVAFENPQVKQKYAVLAINGDADMIVNVTEGRKTRDTYAKWGHDVEYIELPGHTHIWNGFSDINEKIWAFFEKHPLQSPTK